MLINIKRLKKTRLVYIILFVLVFLVSSNKKSLAVENEDSFFTAQSKPIFEDTLNPFDKSNYFSFVIKNLQTGKTYVVNEKQASKRVSPASTFKIPLSLMGYDANILLDEKNPKFEYNKEYKAPIESWKNDHTPETWMKYSVVWYSQELTVRLGLKNFQNYVELFNYGNKDIKGNPQRGSFLINGSSYVSFAGLLNSWLSSTLKISPFEQVDFLQKLVENKLPVSPKAMDMTKKIAYRGKLNNNFNLFGKTGTGAYYLDGKNQIRLLWFVGWLEKEGKTYVFASNRYVNVLESDPFFPYADKVSRYLEENFSKFDIQ